MDTHERALNDAHNFRTAGELAQLAGEAVITRDPDAAELAGLAATAYTQDRPELDADTVRFSVCVPPALRVVVPLDGETVIALLLVVAFQLTLSAKVVEVSVTAAG